MFRPTDVTYKQIALKFFTVYKKRRVHFYGSRVLFIQNRFNQTSVDWFRETYFGSELDTCKEIVFLDMLSQITS